MFFRFPKRFWPFFLPRSGYQVLIFAPKLLQNKCLPIRTYVRAGAVAAGEDQPDASSPAGHEEGQERRRWLGEHRRRRGGKDQRRRQGEEGSAQVQREAGQHDELLQEGVNAILEVHISKFDRHVFVPVHHLNKRDDGCFQRGTVDNILPRAPFRISFVRVTVRVAEKSRFEQLAQGGVFLDVMCMDFCFWYTEGNFCWRLSRLLQQLPLEIDISTESNGGENRLNVESV